MFKPSCDCGGTVFYLDKGRGEVCRTCGRDGHRRAPTLKERRAPNNRVYSPYKEEFYLLATIDPPKETDCLYCLHPEPRHYRDCITREPEPEASGVGCVDGRRLAYVPD